MILNWRRLYRSVVSLFVRKSRWKMEISRERKPGGGEVATKVIKK